MSFLSLSLSCVFSLPNHQLDRYLDGCHSLDIMNTAIRVSLHYADSDSLGDVLRTSRAGSQGGSIFSVDVESPY